LKRRTDSIVVRETTGWKGNRKDIDAGVDVGAEDDAIFL
jgi:hypothetical protein